LKIKKLNPTRIWLGFFAIWMILLTGLLDFWFHSPGLKQWYQVEASLNTYRQEIAAIEAKTTIQLEVARQLENNSVAQEREIRKVLGYLGDQELVFEFEP
jgi:hypothetical protein